MVFLFVTKMVALHRKFAFSTHAYVSLHIEAHYSKIFVAIFLWKIPPFYLCTTLLQQRLQKMYTNIHSTFLKNSRTSNDFLKNQIRLNESAKGAKTQTFQPRCHAVCVFSSEKCQSIDKRTPSHLLRKLKEKWRPTSLLVEL